MFSLSWMAASLTPSSKSRCLNFSVDNATFWAAGAMSSALDTRGNMSFTAFNASTHAALSSLLSALKCSLFFVPVYTENLLSSDLLSPIEHTCGVRNISYLYYEKQNQSDFFAYIPWDGVRRGVCGGEIECENCERDDGRTLRRWPWIHVRFRDWERSYRDRGFCNRRERRLGVRTNVDAIHGHSWPTCKESPRFHSLQCR